MTIMWVYSPKGKSWKRIFSSRYKIKKSLALDANYFVRANYSANADIVLLKKDSVMSIKEALLRFDKKTEKPYVELKKDDGTWEKKEIEVGVSDGINIEVKKGLTFDDEIKIWNKASKEKNNNN